MPSRASDGSTLFVPQLVLGGHQVVGTARHFPVHARGRLAVGPGDFGADLDLRLQAGDADLEELVQVAADDAQEAQALEQRNGRVGGLGQHAAIELEQTELAVEIVLRQGALRHSIRQSIVLLVAQRRGDQPCVVGGT